MLSIDHGMESGSKLEKPRSKSNLKEQKSKTSERKKKRVQNYAPMQVQDDHYKTSEQAPSIMDQKI